MDEKHGTAVADRETTTTDHAHDKVHPVGSGVGAAAGAATGAAVGTAVGGPVGTLVGAAVGAVAGGLVGHGIAEGINPTEEETYWRENYRTRPYARPDRTYEDYEPAYRYGWESRARYGNRNWDEVEPELGRNWNEYNRGSARQTWDEAKLATKDAWHRVEDRLPGDADRDGR
ncbi:MAG TPA: glycine zipper domain-containing protein [Gemmatimonadales bacterium]|nr:glycine zipper domain-containing protein [Gemmatimonadales bacterium]